TAPGSTTGAGHRGRERPVPLSRAGFLGEYRALQAGQIKAYAIGTPERSPALPDVLTSQGCQTFRRSPERHATARPQGPRRRAACWSLGAYCRARASLKCTPWGGQVGDLRIG